MVVTRSGGRKALSKGVISDESGIVCVCVSVSVAAIYLCASSCVLSTLVSRCCGCVVVLGCTIFQDVSSRLVGGPCESCLVLGERQGRGVDFFLGGLVAWLLGGVQSPPAASRLR